MLASYNAASREAFAAAGVHKLPSTARRFNDHGEPRDLSNDFLTNRDAFVSRRFARETQNPWR